MEEIEGLVIYGVVTGPACRLLAEDGTIKGQVLDCPIGAMPPWH